MKRQTTVRRIFQDDIAHNELIQFRQRRIFRRRYSSTTKSNASNSRDTPTLLQFHRKLYIEHPIFEEIHRFDEWRVRIPV